MAESRMPEYKNQKKNQILHMRVSLLSRNIVLDNPLLTRRPEIGT